MLPRAAVARESGDIEAEREARHFVIHRPKNFPGAGAIRQMIATQAGVSVDTLSKWEGRVLRHFHIRRGKGKRAASGRLKTQGR
jgi:hypothetical protein